jgi:hypothetical protein
MVASESDRGAFDNRFSSVGENTTGDFEALIQLMVMF